MNKHLKQFLISANQPIIEAMRQIDRNARGIVLVVDDQNKMIGTVTDGDIRRAIIHHVNLNESVEQIARGKQGLYAQPITARLGTDIETLRQMMNTYLIKQIPLIDDQQRVVDIITWEDLTPESEPELVGVVMAGGFGRRLEPLTFEKPKPMLEIGGRPLMEHILLKFKKVGVNEVFITTHYKAESIIEYFGDGENFGLKIKYIEEEVPLGTAGALRLLPMLNKPLLVMNGDVLTSADIRALWLAHQSSSADMCVAVREYIYTIPYGVLDIDGNHILSLEEKPQIKKFINAGIYSIMPELLQLIPDNIYFDMTDLIKRSIKSGRKVASFPIIEYWIDIGQYKDYKKANEDFENGKLSLGL